MEVFHRCIVLPSLQRVSKGPLKGIVTALNYLTYMHVHVQTFIIVTYMCTDIHVYVLVTLHSYMYTSIYMYKLDNCT